MSRWKKILAKSITRPEQLRDALNMEIDVEGIRKVVSKYPMRINPYYLSLIREKNDPIYLQAVPDRREIEDERGIEDPLKEEELSPVPGLTHKYPDRVLFLVSSQCAMYCRFCNRKRKVGRADMVTKKSIEEGISYIKGNREIKEVLLSGGDPFLLSDREIYEILSRLREISHVEVIRIGTRVPCTFPYRITKRLVNILKRFHPIYVITHFNHPREITNEAEMACRMLVNSGIPLLCQTVFLKGVNDNTETMKALLRKLIKIRVKPYYLFYPDYVRGTAHFWPPIEKGIQIMRSLYGYISGLCIPLFAIDLTNGGGKIPVFPKYTQEERKDKWIIRNYKGEIFEFNINQYEA